MIFNAKSVYLAVNAVYVGLLKGKKWPRPISMPKTNHTYLLLVLLAVMRLVRHVGG
jgi:hypothetical protein